MKKKYIMTKKSEKQELSPPWAIFWRSIDALFSNDPEVNVVYDEDDLTVNVYVNNSNKAYALSQLLPSEKVFGNVKLTINVVPADVDTDSIVDLFNAAFEGNPIFSYTKEAQKAAFGSSYIVFKPEVIQYFDDDLTDINGNRTAIAADIAKEVFGSLGAGINICSDVLPK